MCTDDYFCNGWEEATNRCYYGFVMDTSNAVYTTENGGFLKDRNATKCPTTWNGTSLMDAVPLYLSLYH